ncbi:FMN-binding negative transcriptional regulator [Sphingomonas prati]|uniref:Transcriptional regulator n=1 Tax=Sphingomonas prati TaxID=1843237 RepID=A0A7W9F090_9SPHN|nr:FMN-binding negative transcriptional regulator [Sphingomonas prati]MBB5728086.1 transcriptional regulator [Sphingomonas prati]GGE83132.1 transcriptional regulator [Sphingomonas prati]
MHPDPAFAWTDADAIRAFVDTVAFAHIFVAGPNGAAVVHAPVLPVGPDRLQFHMPYRNRATPLIANAVVIASFGGVQGYVSPDWYGVADQVPSWNYRAVEAEGLATPLDRDGLISHLDRLSDAHERQLAPKPAWTRHKMSPGRFDAMLGAIAGYELIVTEWRGTAKLSQNKPARVVDALLAHMPDGALAAEIRSARPAIPGTRS